MRLAGEQEPDAGAPTGGPQPLPVAPGPEPGTAARRNRRLALPPTLDSTRSLLLFNLALIVLISYVDYLTGVNIRLFPFYFIPVSLVTWRAGGKLGVAAAVLCAAGMEGSDALAGKIYSSPWVDVWNIFMHLASFVVVAGLIAAQRREVEKERTLSRLDGLTGVANARAFYEAAAAELLRARRYRHPLALVYLDIDDFKSVNDQLGHKAGDELLVRLAQTLERSTRENDLVARLGGDEFAVLLPEADAEATRSVVEKLRFQLRQARSATGRPATVSMGAVCSLTPMGSVDEMVHLADSLMYQVKISGKDGVKMQVTEVVSTQESMPQER